MFVDYWTHAFPFRTVYKLFSRPWQLDGPPADRREYGIETHPDGQYRRWKDCANEEALHAFVKHPKFGKLNIGAQMDKRPSLRWKCPSGSEPKPVQREFVIDIDQDDYNYLGIKKTDLAACDAAFPVVGVGLEVCMDILRSEFGFQHILPVYSGRRGGHLWVCDKRACLMNDGARKAIVEFLKPGQKVHASGRKTFKWLLQYPAFGSPENPMQKHGVFQRIVYKFFRGMGTKAREKGGLGLLDVGFDRAAFLGMIDDRFAKDLESKVRAVSTGKDALLVIEAALRDKPADVKTWLVPRFCEAICTLVWPRIDDSVSTHINHTLKSPFSVHPKTGRVSVPILGKRNLWDFDPSIEAPMASAEMPASFDSVVLQTNQFITNLSHSDTETWQPPDLSRLGPPPKRRRYDVTVGTSEDCTPILSEATRVAWVADRQLNVYVDDEGVAHFEMATYSYRPSAAIVIQPHQFPPFREQINATRFVEMALGSIRASEADRNTAFSILSWQQIVIVDPEVQSESESLRKANARFERLRERLAEGTAIGKAKTAWGDVALNRYVEDILWPYCEELRSV